MKEKTKTQTSKPKVKKNTEKKNPEWERLAGELRSLIPKLDEEGLDFLVKQAQIHLYNLQVDALNKTLVDSHNRAAAKSKASQKNGKTTTKNAQTPDGFSEIKVSGSGASFYLVYKTEWIMLSREEMAMLANIARSKGTALEIKERLFNWLKRERTDILNSAAIANKFDDKLKTLAALLKKAKA